MALGREQGCACVQLSARTCQQAFVPGALKFPTLPTVRSGGNRPDLVGVALSEEAAAWLYGRRMENTGIARESLMPRAVRIDGDVAERISASAIGKTFCVITCCPRSRRVSEQRGFLRPNAYS